MKINFEYIKTLLNRKYSPEEHILKIAKYSEVTIQKAEELFYELKAITNDSEDIIKRQLENVNHDAIKLKYYCMRFPNYPESWEQMNAALILSGL